MTRAPADCRQYFTGTSGTVMSYNFAGNQMLQSQIYTNCFRQELGNLNYLYLNNIIKFIRYKQGIKTKSTQTASDKSWVIWAIHT
jgi:hypothetical protein